MYLKKYDHNIIVACVVHNVEDGVDINAGIIIYYIIYTISVLFI